MTDKNSELITNFLYEIGTLRKIPRMHRQQFLTNDDSDNIATHSFRVAWIGRFIAILEKLEEINRKEVRDFKYNFSNFFKESCVYRKVIFFNPSVPSIKSHVLEGKCWPARIISLDREL